MNSQLAPPPGRHDHPPQPVRSPAPHPGRRVSLLDRAAMQLGVALIRWGRRPATAHRDRPVLAAESIRAHRDLDSSRDQNLGLSLTRFR